MWANKRYSRGIPGFHGLWRTNDVLYIGVGEEVTYRFQHVLFKAMGPPYRYCGWSEIQGPIQRVCVALVTQHILHYCPQKLLELCLNQCCSIEVV